MRVRSYIPDCVEPRFPEDPLTVQHGRACPDHGTLLDDECNCPHHHTPDRWYVVRIKPGAQPCVVCESAVSLGPYIPGPTKYRTKADRRRAGWLAAVTFRLRRKGWSKERAREEAERRWGLR